MRLLRIEVKDLFDCYSYPIEMVEDRAITIIHAPNGYGKTTLLKLTKYALELKFAEIYEIPFCEFELWLEGNVKIVIRKKNIPSVQRNAVEGASKIEYMLYVGEEKYSFAVVLDKHRNEMLKSEDLTFLEFLHREEIRRRRHAPDDRMTNEQERITDDYMRLENALKSLNDGMGVQINFIDSNRLFSSPENRERNHTVINISEERGVYGRRIYEEPVGVERENIVNFSKALQFQIRGIRQKYSDVSEIKDRDFPDRLVQYVFSERDSLTEEEIAEKLIELEKIREDLEKVGLVSEGKTTTLPKNKNLDPTMLKFYSQYIEDNEDKLKIFDGMKRKLELFLDIINNKTKFSNKVMRIDKNKGVVFESTLATRKRDIPLDKLSSGEKHDFILFYQLIFHSKRNSIVLIDEPEISLHVAWQMEFVGVIKKICELNGIQAIIATHSPDIVNGNNDILVSLGE